MEEIASGVYISSEYLGVTVGAVLLPKGTLLIDSPLQSEDGKSWLAALRSVGNGAQKLIVNLDSHPDRTLGAHALGEASIAHKKTAVIFKQRIGYFKSQSIESGAVWETCDGLSGVRWLVPCLSFTDQVSIQWGGDKVLLEHHPGPEPGAMWIHIPTLKVLFVGDAVVIGQPPFLANANLQDWLDTLSLLFDDRYKDYLIVSSRGGLVADAIIREQHRFLKDLKKKLDRLGRKRASPKATERLIPKIMSELKHSDKDEEMYVQRLRYGLLHYYSNQYRSTSSLFSLT